VSFWCQSWCQPRTIDDPLNVHLLSDQQLDAYEDPMERNSVEESEDGA
jgi:hypothetical protein